MKFLKLLKRILVCGAIATAASALSGAEAPSLPLSTNAVSAVSAAATPAADAADAQCEAITKSGKRCKRRKTAGAKLCRQHQLIEQKRAAK